MCAAVKVFLTHVLSRTAIVSSVRSFARALLRSRHRDGLDRGRGRSLAQEQARLRAHKAAFLCLRDNSTGHADLRNRFGMVWYGMRTARRSARS